LGDTVDFQSIKYERFNRIAILTINRLDKRNALNLVTRKEISSVLDNVGKDLSIGCLIVTGAGDKAFISGSDLTELSKMSSIEVLDFANTLGQQLYSKFESLDIPVIAMINGYCLGGGLEVAMACDIRISADTAKFGQPEVHLGIIPGSGATQRLPRLIGHGLAREMIYAGEMIDADTALRIGLVNRICPISELREKTISLAEKIASKSAFSIRMAKRAMVMGQDVGQSFGLAYEALAQSVVFTSKDKNEGMDAFFKKRTPLFNQE
jgi:enoyl-CoA hydratase